jgi:hypothetical protein
MENCGLKIFLHFVPAPGFSPQYLVLLPTGPLAKIWGAMHVKARKDRARKIE